MAHAQGAYTFDSPIRLDAGLAAGTALGASASAKRRVFVQDAGTIHVIVNASGVTGTPTVALHPMSSPATFDEDDGAARIATDAPAAVTLANGENEINYTSQGEAYVEIEVVSGAGEAVTLDSIDVFVKL